MQILTDGVIVVVLAHTQYPEMIKQLIIQLGTGHRSYTVGEWGFLMQNIAITKRRENCSAASK